ncbi:hypothetical protein F4779DRAFT_578502 [Xylariaceae sp. FL0662B]|nr:hypothetical protein F4779DRAFT_578502 [Xylariaceae sp. FL0662B]
MKATIVIASIISTLPMFAVAKDELWFYGEPNYKGKAVGFNNPQELLQTPCKAFPKEWDNQMRSVKLVGTGMWCRVFDDDNCVTMLTDIDHSMPSLPPGADKKISSIRCSKN